MKTPIDARPRGAWSAEPTRVVRLGNMDDDGGGDDWNGELAGGISVVGACAGTSDGGVCVRAVGAIAMKGYINVNSVGLIAMMELLL